MRPTIAVSLFALAGLLPAQDQAPATAADREIVVPRSPRVSPDGSQIAFAWRGDVWVAYLQAKRAAEEALRLTDLDWTILRPGGLTDDPGTGRVQLSRPPVDPGSITRDDTAAVLLALLDSPGTAGLTLELVEGDDDVLAAVAAVAVSSGANC